MAPRPSFNVVTAFAGGGQIGSTPLAYGVNVATAASAQDSVMLPAATMNSTCTVVNGGTNGVAVFPAPGETINANAPDEGVLLQGQSRTFSDADFGWQMTLYCVVDGKWFG